MTIALLTPLRLNGISASVSDPCYYPDSTHMIHTVQRIAQGGSWTFAVEIDEIADGWGDRVTEMIATHSSHQAEGARNAPESQMEFEGNCGVDSGQMSICGVDDIDRFENRDYVGGFNPDANSGLFNYEGACDITLTRPEKAGVLCDVMGVCQSGLGDGVYPLYVGRNADGMATRIVVDFRLAEEDDDEDDEESEPSDVPSDELVAA